MLNDISWVGWWKKSAWILNIVEHIIFFFNLLDQWNTLVPETRLCGKTSPAFALQHGQLFLDYTNWRMLALVSFDVGHSNFYPSPNLVIESHGLCPQLYFHHLLIGELETMLDCLLIWPRASISRGLTLINFGWFLRQICKRQVCGLPKHGISWCKLPKVGAQPKKWPTAKVAAIFTNHLGM